MTLALLLSGKWLAGVLHAGMAAYNGRTFLRKEHRVDATDVFQKVSFQKKLRIGKLVFYLLSFILIIYRQVSWRSPPVLCPPAAECGVLSVMRV